MCTGQVAPSGWTLTHRRWLPFPVAFTRWRDRLGHVHLVIMVVVLFVVVDDGDGGGVKYFTKRKNY